MKILKSIIILLFISASIYAQTDTTNYSIFMNDRNKLAFNLFNMLKSETENDIISPYFLNLSFSEIYLATKDNTSLQVGAFAYFSKDKNKHKKNIQHLEKIVKDNNNINTIFRYSINIFINDSTDVNQKFQTSLKHFFADSIQKSFFNKDTDSTINAINKIIEKNTSGNIQNAFKKESLSKNPSMLAFSGAFFTGKWANNFSEYIYAPFYSDSTKTETIKYLTNDDYFKYAESNEYQIIELPYDNYNLSLLIILPKKDSSLENISSYFNYNSFLMWQRNMLQTQRIRLILPQISIEKSYNIKKNIKKYTPFIFIKGGNFLNMIKKVVFISNIQHNAKFDFDNENQLETELKSIDFEKEIATKGSYIFNANHPYLFILIDKKSQTILFMGKFTNKE